MRVPQWQCVAIGHASALLCSRAPLLWLHPVSQCSSTPSCPRRLPVAFKQQLLQPVSALVISQPMHAFYPPGCLFAPKALYAIYKWKIRIWRRSSLLAFSLIHILPQSSKQWALPCPAPAQDTAAAQEKVPFPNPSHPDRKGGFSELPACQPAAGQRPGDLLRIPSRQLGAVVYAHCFVQHKLRQNLCVRPGTLAELRTHDLPVASPEGDLTTRLRHQPEPSGRVRAAACTCPVSGEQAAGWGALLSRGVQLPALLAFLKEK